MHRAGYQNLDPKPWSTTVVVTFVAAASLAFGVAVGVLTSASNQAALYSAPVATSVRSIRAVAPVGKVATSNDFMSELLADAHQADESEIAEMASVAPHSQALGNWASGLAAAAAAALSTAVFKFMYQKRVPALGPLDVHIESDNHFNMAGTGAMVEVKDIPAHFGKDADPACLRRRFEAMLRKGQDKICAAIEKCDGGATFQSDCWVREGGGGGLTRVLGNGKVWEKAGVNLSVIYGSMPSETLAAARERQAAYAKDLVPGERVPFFACGLSCVMHPRNPHCPTMHFNYRYFETEAGDWWFAGGTDITPAYLDEEDMKHFHGVYKKVCDNHDPEFYPKFKKWADEYFLIKHRGETRGLGGIFFDDLNDRDPLTIFDFAAECLDNVVPAYVPIIEKHKNDAFTPEQKRWQLIRRGRYAEFNLIYDRGFIFGLKTGIGRMESIMMTLPQFARWEYDQRPEPDSPEAEILELFKNPKEWV